MAGSRSTPPLYELLRESEHASPVSRETSTPQAVPGKPKVVVKPVPLTQPAPEAPDSSPNTEPDQPKVHGRSITFTPSGIMLGFAGFLVIALVLWVVGWKSGASKIDQEWSEAVGGAGAETQLKDPLGEDSASGNLAIPGQDPSNDSNQPQPEQNQAEQTPQPPASGDTRHAGLNYLHLVTLGKEDADAAVAFLAENGVQATAAIDPGSSRSNNRARYKVFALVGITGEQYKNNDPAKLLHEQEIREIGARWLGQGGASNFSQPLWTKFQG